MKADLMAIFAEQWRAMQADMRALQVEVRQISLQPRAEVAGSVPVYDTLTSLPTAGQVGRVAATADTGKLYFDNGSTWQEVSLV